MRGKRMVSSLLITGLFILLPGVVSAGQWANAYGSGSLAGDMVPVTGGTGYYLTGHKPNAFGAQDTVFGLINPSGAVSWAEEIDWSTKYADAFSVEAASGGGFLVKGSKVRPDIVPKNGLVGYATWAKFDKSWKQVYAYSFGAPSISVLGGFWDTSDGGLIFTGSLVEFPYSEAECINTFIFKTGSNGQLLWKDEWFHGCVDAAEQAVEVSDGYLVAGTLADPATKVPSIFVVKLAKNNGGIIWTKMYSFPSLTLDMIGAVDTIKQLSDGNFLLSGIVTELGSPGVAQTLLVKIDPAGDIMWQNSYGISNMGVGAVGVVEDTSDKTIVASGVLTDPKTNNSSILAMKVDSSNGSIVKQTQIWVPSGNVAGAVVQSKWGWYLTGQSWTSSSSNQKLVFGRIDPSTLKPLWAKVFDEGAKGTGMAIETASGFLLTGTTYSYGSNPSKGNIFGILVDSSGNYKNCVVNPITLMSSLRIITPTSPGFKITPPSLTPEHDGTFSGITLPVTSVKIPTSSIYKPVTAGPAGDLPADEENSPDLSCGEDALASE